MRRIELTWEDWRAVIAVLRTKALPYRLEQDDLIEPLLEQHPPDDPIVRLSLTEVVFLRSTNWARSQLGFFLPAESVDAPAMLRDYIAPARRHHWTPTASMPSPGP